MVTRSYIRTVLTSITAQAVSEQQQEAQTAVSMAYTCGSPAWG